MKTQVQSHLCYFVNSRLTITILVLVIVLLLILSEIKAQEPTASIQSIAWNHTGSHVAVGYGTGRQCIANRPDLYFIQVIETATNQVLYTLPGGDCTVTELDWSPDDTKLASASRDNVGVRLWDMGSGELIAQASSFTLGVEDVKWSPDGTMLAVAGFASDVYLVDSTTVEILRSIVASGRTLDWSPDGTKLLSGNNGAELYISDVISGQTTVELSGHSSFIRSVDWSPDGIKLASASADNTVRIWDATNGVLLFTILGHTDVVTVVKWSPDSSQLATGSFDETLRVWNANTGELQSTIEVPNGFGVFSLSWNPDGTQLIFDGEGNNTAMSVLTFPIANAGADQTSTTTTITLDGSASFDPDGTIDSYSWSENGVEIATGVSPQVQLGIGTHTITLTVTDDDGATATDDVVITVSPGEGWMVFVSDRTGADNLFMSEEGVGDPIQLTFNDQQIHKYWSPVWSPDYKFVAFSRYVDTDYDICILNVQSGSILCDELSINGNTKQDYPAWSTFVNQATGINGQVVASIYYLAYVSDEDGDRDIYKVQVDSNGNTVGSPFNLTNRATNDGEDNHPDWRGDWITYSSNRDGNSEIFVMWSNQSQIDTNADGQQRTKLTVTTAISNRQPAWSPNGNRIAYTSNAAGEDDIIVMNVSNSTGSWVVSNPVNITQNRSGDYVLTTWRKFGITQTKIALVRQINNRDIYIVTLASPLSNSTFESAPWNTINYMENDPDW